MNNYILISDSKTLIDKKIEELINNGFKDALVTHYDLEENSINSLIEDADTISFLSPNKVIIGDNFSTNNNLEPLLKYIDNPNDDVLLILTTKKLDERKKEIKTLMKKTNYLKLEVSPKDILDMEFASYKVDFKVLRLLEEYYASDNERLISECQKLKLAFLESKNITYKEAEELLIKPLNNQDNLSFSLVRNIAIKDKKSALLNYQELLNYNIEFFTIMGLLESQYRLLYQVMILSKQNISYNDMAKILDVHPFRVKKTLELLSYYTKKELTKIIKNLASLDYKVKSGEMDKDLIIDLLILNN